MNQKYMVKKNPDQRKVVRIDFIQENMITVANL